MRLRVGCIRWQHSDGGPGAATTHQPGDGATCLLDVPTHKTGTSYTKPVDPLVGEAIANWEARRPVQPLLFDRTTGEQVATLFCFRGRPVPTEYFNRALIPLLCRKAGVPLADARGRITSHRARATIASQLYNAKEPMTLFELQAWLGHRSPAATQHYARIAPTTLAKAYADAGYFARNVRTIEVLVDREAVVSGAAAAGKPWQYFDLGHGYVRHVGAHWIPFTERRGSERLTSGLTAYLAAKAKGDTSMPSKRERSQRRLGPGPARPARYGESWIA